MDVKRDNKPKRIKALLSSFLKKDTQVNSQNPQKSLSSEDVTAGLVKKDSIDIPAVTIVPLSKEKFIERVDTFTTSRWFAKPHKLSPLHCARYGWQNSEVDTLSCVSCKELFYVSLPPIWQKEQYSQACEEMIQRLSSAHRKICPWSGSPSPESFVTMVMANHKEEVARYHERVKRLSEIFSSLPSVEFSVLKVESPEDSAALDRLTDYTKTLTDSKENITDDVWKIIIVMALFGWHRSSDSLSLPVVKCESCRKQAGLWDYASPGCEIDNDESNQEQETEEPPQKKLKDDKLSSFNPASEHRPWCPWVLPHPRRNKGGQQDNRPAWLLLLDMLLSKADPDQYGSSSPLTDKKQTPPRNAWKAVRRLVSFWQSSDGPKEIGSSPSPVK